MRVVIECDCEDCGESFSVDEDLRRIGKRSGPPIAMCYACAIDPVTWLRRAMTEVELDDQCTERDEAVADIAKAIRSVKMLAARGDAEAMEELRKEIIKDGVKRIVALAHGDA